MTTKPNPNALSSIAKTMASHAARYPLLAEPPERLPASYRHKLAGGLRLALYCGPANWHLSIIREKVPPSPTEARVVREAFNVPDWAIAQGPLKEIVTKPTRSGWAKVYTYHVISISWNHKLEFASNEQLLEA